MNTKTIQLAEPGQIGLPLSPVIERYFIIRPIEVIVLTCLRYPGSLRAKRGFRGSVVYRERRYKPTDATLGRLRRVVKSIGLDKTALSVDGLKWRFSGVSVERYRWGVILRHVDIGERALGLVTLPTGERVLRACLSTHICTDRGAK